MTINISPTSKEYSLNATELIVTKTDLKGNITYANETFLNISIFNEKDILAKPHNIIRHPDMPKAVFKLLWNTLKSGDEFFGIIKNMCSDGGYYWVFANVTPSYGADNEVIGYFSVRRKANPALVKIMSELYQTMCDVEKKASSTTSAIEQSTQVLQDFIKKQGVSYNEYLISFA